MENISQEEDGKKSYKNIALFVGPSGSGKTTIILSLLGYNLIET
jgi:ABC-type multidrug transport system ATPase subunit